MSSKTFLAAAALVLVAACAPKRIPGTEIDDTDDTRAILKVMEAYRSALEQRDAPKVLAVVAESFKDDLGTPAAGDDLDYLRLRDQLPQSLARLDDVKVEMTVRKVDVNKADLTARAVYTYSTSFRMPSLSSKPQSESEIKEMKLLKVAGAWKITSGI